MTKNRPENYMSILKEEGKNIMIKIIACMRADFELTIKGILISYIIVMNELTEISIYIYIYIYLYIYIYILYIY